MRVLFETPRFEVSGCSELPLVTFHIGSRKRFESMVQCLKVKAPRIDFSYSDHLERYCITLHSTSSAEKNELLYVVKWLAETKQISHRMKHEILTEISNRDLPVPPAGDDNREVMAP